jgi:hypothetical protein
MNGILSSFLLALLPLLWATVLSVYFRQKISSPFLFFTAAALSSFGIQAIISAFWPFWPFWPFGSGYILETAITEAEFEKAVETLNQAELMKAAITFAITAPFLGWLTAGFHSASGKR